MIVHYLSGKFHSNWNMFNYTFYTWQKASTWSNKYVSTISSQLIIHHFINNYIIFFCFTRRFASLSSLFVLWVWMLPTLASIRAEGVSARFAFPIKRICVEDFRLCIVECERAAAGCRTARPREDVRSDRESVGSQKWLVPATGLASVALWFVKHATIRKSKVRWWRSIHRPKCWYSVSFFFEKKIATFVDDGYSRARTVCTSSYRDAV